MENTETTTATESTPRSPLTGGRTRSENAKLLVQLFSAAIPPQEMEMVEIMFSPTDLTVEITNAVIENPRANLQAQMGAAALALMAMEENFTWTEIHQGIGELALDILKQLADMGDDEIG